MKKKVLYLRNSEGVYQVVLDAVDDCYAFEKLAKYLVSVHGAELIDSFEGPGTDIWTFLLQGEKISLIYDDCDGNCLSASSQAGEKLITAIGKELEICFHYLPS